MQIIPLTGSIGATITGADIRDPEQFGALRQAFIDHAVITVRGQQDASPDDQLAFARSLGEINVNRFFTPLDSHPNIAIVLKEPDQTTAIGEGWHTDHSYDTEPAMCSILRAIELPPFGGDTCFASMYAAYDALSDRFKGMLDGLQAWHSSRHAFGATTTDHEQYQSGRLQNAEKATQDALHPVIITHPLSGRKAIYVNPDFTTRIDGLAQAESDALLQFLYTHNQNPDFQCRVQWQVGDVTMWDNRATWHKAINDYHGHRRYMHRVTVEGCALTA
ncbi:MAG: TauD/TfdA family dioxygenase [Pseudomonadota bacterium]